MRQILVMIILFGLSIPSERSIAQTNNILPLQLSDSSYTIPFKWLGDTVNGNWEPHAAMLVPVNFTGSERDLYMQFDLGSPYTMFYTGKAWLMRKLLNIPANVPDSVFRKGLKHFKLDQLPVTSKEMAWKEYGEAGGASLLNGEKIQLIGTVGTDLISGRSLWIDYPQQTIVVGPAPAEPAVEMTNMYYAGGRILLPATVLGKQTLLFFDTGTSAFSLLTDQASFVQLAQQGVTPAQYQVNSWGTMLTAHTAPTRQMMEMAGTTLPIGDVTYMEGANTAMADQMRKAGIGGMIGNKLFLHYRLMIDTRNKRFALIRSTSGE